MSGDLDHTKMSLVPTTDTVVKEGNNDKVDKEEKSNKMFWRKPSLLVFQQKKDSHGQQNREITSLQ